MSEKHEKILNHFKLEGTVSTVSPLGNGLINDTFKVITAESDKPDYVLQRINDNIFQDVPLLQHNIEVVTSHIYAKLAAQNTPDISRKVLKFIPTDEGHTYYYDGENYWRVSVYIPRSVSYEQVDEKYSYLCGKAFGQFQAMLADVKENLGETIPDFHNMEFRLKQFQEAIDANTAKRLDKVQDMVDSLLSRSEDMCQAERLYRESKLPKRICHCDTKVNNMLFDEGGDFLCVIDLDTVMPSFIFSDYGDFLRTAANTVAEDSPEYDKIAFREDIYKSFTKGYFESAKVFLTDLEVEMLPYAVKLFPYMQCVRFLTDYLNGDTYYKIKYPEHNLVRSINQLRYLECIEKYFAK